MMNGRSTAVLHGIERPKSRGKAQIAFAAALSCLPTSSRGGKEPPCNSCDENRFVVAANCASISVPGWAAASPFGVPAASLPAALRNWCLLTAPAGTPLPPQPVQIGEDRPSVFPQSSLFAQVLWPWLHSRFLAQTSAASNLPIGSVPLDPVEVAVIDDAEDNVCAPGEPGIGTRKHGRTLGLLIRELACPFGQAGCPVYIANHRALQCNGGMSGTRSQLARSIYEAVIGWQTREAQRPVRSRLVINLSVGFVDDGSPASVLVKTAIDLAVCHGALVIGAAGNVLPDGSGSGPLMPGGWETISTPATCNAYAMNSSRGYDASPATRPLVIAAGGVEAQNGWLPLVTTRPGGQAALTAASFQVAVPEPLGGSSEVLTGSSVSSAVISAIAAAVWTRSPSLLPAQVVAAIRSSGTSLGTPADFGLAPNQNADIRVAGVCPAVEYACSAWYSPACGPILGWPCATPDSSAAAWPVALVAQTYFPTDHFDTCAQPTEPSAPTTCSELQEIELPEPFCSGGKDGEVGPQPGDLGCGACSVSGNSGELYLVVDDTYKGDFIPLDIVFKRTDGMIVRPFQALSLPVLHAGEKLMVTLSPGQDPLPSGGQAWLEYTSDAQAPVSRVPLAWWW